MNHPELESCIFKTMDIFKLIGIVGDCKAARFAVKPVGSRLAARFNLGLIARGSAGAQGGFHHEEPEQLSEL
jgi:hypothetical protein